VPTQNYRGRAKRFSPSPKFSRLALEPTLQPSIQWVPGLFSWAYNSQGVQLTTPSSAKVRNEWRCMSPPPVSLQGMDRHNFVFMTLSFKHYHICVISENYCNCYLFVCVCIGVNNFFLIFLHLSILFSLSIIDTLSPHLFALFLSHPFYLCITSSFLYPFSCYFMLKS
jgi:hypothetical protein